ncbi:MAG TPA: uroporphyrinogen decarboxylase family protein [Phycisphaerae bacterium]|nr:uroporphyrinogen decarboxylase family protein [Phycisphaerae bacterium]HNU46604.1 uroporphyrinogen decarboxylase family protein [Phycisphaerae bacterium]
MTDMLTRREIVERAITFRTPPRLPLKFDVVGVNDCYDVWTHDPTGWTWDFTDHSTDEWGCIWQRTSVSNTGPVTGHPLQDLAALPRYTWPDPDHPARYRDFAQQVAGADDRFVMFCFGNGIWERLHMLHGMSESLMNLLRRPDEMHALLDRILEHHLRVLDNCARLAGGRLHAAAMADDWGLQDRPFVSVKLFRTFFKPRYQRWFDRIKAAGMHPWMHSCGHVNELIEELIDCGLQVINLQQPNVVGIDAIGQRYRGRICFESIVDTQSTLPRGTHDEIRAQARELVDKWGTPTGGFIASDYNDAEAIGVTTDRRLVMFEAFAERGRYPDYQRIVADFAGPRAGHAWGRAAG